MKLAFSPRARGRLREIQTHLAFVADLNTALRVVTRIQQSTEILCDFPGLGPRWQGGETRALIVSGLPYRIHYRLKDDTVHAHTSQKPPRLG